MSAFLDRSFRKYKGRLIYGPRNQYRNLQKLRAVLRHNACVEGLGSALLLLEIIKPSNSEARYCRLLGPVVIWVSFSVGVSANIRGA